MLFCNAVTDLLVISRCVIVWPVCVTANYQPVDWSVLFQLYIEPRIAISDISDDSNKFDNFRLYGTILLICMATIVFVGVKFVNIFATIALVCVLGSIVSVYVGMFVNTGGSDALM